MRYVLPAICLTLLSSFDDDRKDAGEIGAGHSVTALYEVVLTPHADTDKPVAELRLRYKQPRGDVSKLRTFALYDGGTALSKTTDAFRFSAGVAEFAMLLRSSPHAGRSTWASAERLAKGAMGVDPGGHRRDFLTMLAHTEALAMASKP